MFDRSAAVKLQLRDAKGRFIKMGSHVKWTSLATGNEVSGIVRGEHGNNVLIEFKHNGKAYNIHVPHGKIEVINQKAQLDDAYVQKMGGHTNTPGIHDPGVTPANTPSAAPAGPIKNFATLSTNETYYRIASADGDPIYQSVAGLKIGDEVFPVATAGAFQKSPYNAKGNGKSANIQKFGPGIGKVVKIKDGAYATIEDEKGKQYHVSASHFVLKRDANTEKAVLDAQKLEAATIYAGKTPPNLPWIDGLKGSNAPAAPDAGSAETPHAPSEHVDSADMPIGSKTPLGGGSNHLEKIAKDQWVDNNTGASFDDKAVDAKDDNSAPKTDSTPDTPAFDASEQPLGTMVQLYDGPGHTKTARKVGKGKWKQEGKAGYLNDLQVETDVNAQNGVAPKQIIDKAATDTTPEANPIGDNFSKLPAMSTYQKGDVAVLKDGTLAPWIGKGQITLEDGSKVMGNKFAVDGVEKGLAGKDIAAAYRPKNNIVHSPSNHPFGPDAHGYSFDLSKPNNGNFKAGDFVTYGKENNQGKILSVNPTNILVEKLNSDKTVNGTATIVAGQVHGKYVKDGSSSAAPTGPSDAPNVTADAPATPSESDGAPSTPEGIKLEAGTRVKIKGADATRYFILGHDNEGQPYGVQMSLHYNEALKGFKSSSSNIKKLDASKLEVVPHLGNSKLDPAWKSAFDSWIQNDKKPIGDTASSGPDLEGFDQVALDPSKKLDTQLEIGDKVAWGKDNVGTIHDFGTAGTTNNVKVKDDVTGKTAAVGASSLKGGYKKSSTTTETSAAPQNHADMSPQDKIDAAEKMYGTGSKEHKQAQEKFGKDVAPAEAPNTPATSEDAPEAAPAEAPSAPEAPTEAPAASTGDTPVFPDKGKSITDSEGNTVKANDKIMHPKKGVGTVAIVLPSTDSVKAYYPDGSYAVHKQHTITKVDAEQPSTGALPSDLKVGDSGIDPVTHTKFIVGKNGTLIHQGDKVTHSNGDTGIAKAIYTGEKNKTVSVAWDNGTTSTKKSSVLESEHKAGEPVPTSAPDSAPQGDASAPQDATPEAAPAEPAVTVDAPAESAAPAAAPGTKPAFDHSVAELDALPTDTKLPRQNSYFYQKRDNGYWQMCKKNGQPVFSHTNSSQEVFDAIHNNPDAYSSVDLPAGDAPATSGHEYSEKDAKALLAFKDAQIEIGTHLRGNGDGSYEHAEDIIFGMDGILKESTLKEKTTVWRGFTYTDYNPDPHAPKLADGFVVGTVFRDKSFVSTSQDKNIALQSLNAGEGKKVLLKFDLPAGYHAHSVNYDGLSDDKVKGQSHEQEMILPRNMDFMITGVDKGVDENGNEVTHLSVTGVLMDPADGQVSKGMVQVDPETGIAEKPFQIMDDPGADGDGYHPTGSWGLFGAAGLMVEGKDPVTGENRYLIVENGELHEEKNRGLWQLPGGALNGNENPYQGAAREMWEELGIDPELLGSFDHAGDIVFSNKKEGAKEWKYTNIAAKHAGNTFDVKIDVIETSGAKWVTAAELKQMGADGKLLPAFAANVDSLLEVYGNSPEGKSAIKDFKDFTKVPGSSQAGSNSGGFYTDSKGDKYYVKTGMAEDHARNEILASKIYQAMGVNASNQEPIDMGNGKLGIASKIIPTDGNGHNSNLDNPEYLKKIQENFAVDALLANWDVAGMGYDNILTDANGEPLRIDPGASLKYRAQGAEKSNFGNSVDEWDFLRDGTNHESSGLIYNKKLFGSMTDEQLVESANKLTELTDSKLDSIVDSIGFEEKDAQFFKDTLKARREDILKRASKLKKDDNGQHQGSSGDSGKNDAEAGQEPSGTVQLDSGSGSDHGSAEDGGLVPQVGDTLSLEDVDNLPVGSVVQYGTNGEPMELEGDDKWSFPDGATITHDYLTSAYDDHDLTLVSMPNTDDGKAGELVVGTEVKGKDIRQLPVGSKLKQGTFNYVKKADGAWSQNGTSTPISNEQLAHFFQDGLQLMEIGKKDETPVFDPANPKVGDELTGDKAHTLPVGSEIKTPWGTTYTKKAEDVWGSSLGSVEYTSNDFSEFQKYTIESLGNAPAGTPSPDSSAPTEAASTHKVGDVLAGDSLKELPTGAKIVTEYGSPFEKIGDNKWQSSHDPSDTYSDGDFGTNFSFTIKEMPGTSNPAGGLASGDIVDVDKLDKIPVGGVIETADGVHFTKDTDNYWSANGMGGWSLDSLKHTNNGESAVKVVSVPDAPAAAPAAPSGNPHVGKSMDDPSVPKAKDLPEGTVLENVGLGHTVTKDSAGTGMWKTATGTLIHEDSIDHHNDIGLPWTVKSAPDAAPAASTATAEKPKVGDKIPADHLEWLPEGAEIENPDGIIWSKTGHEQWTSDYGATKEEYKLVENLEDDWKLVTMPDESAPQTAPSSSSVPGKNGEAISVGDDIVWESKGTPGTVVGLDEANGQVQMLLADGTKKWYKSTKMVKKSAPTYQAPKKKEGDPSSPLYGQPKPEMPAADSAEAVAFLPDGFIAEIEQRYAQKVNPSWKKATPQESYYWSKVVDFQSTGNVESLNTLHEKQYISDEMLAKAQEHLKTAQAKLDTQKAAEAKAAADYAEKLKAWKEANGATATAFTSDLLPQTSTEEWTKDNGFVTLADGSQSADWAKAPTGSHSVSSILDTMGSDDLVAAHGMSAMVDSDWIRDNNVRFTKVVGDDGVARIQARFEVSEFHKQDVINQMGPKQSGVKAGFFGYAQGLFSKFSKNGKSISGVNGSTYSKDLGNTQILFQNADTEGWTNNTGALSSSAYVTLPANGTAQDFEAALKAMGITDAHPSTKESVDFSKKKQIVSTFNGWVGEGNTKYEENPALLDTHVNDALKSLSGSYSIDDFKLIHTELGFYHYRVPTKLRDELTAKAGVKAYSHGNIDFLNESHHSKYKSGTDGKEISNVHSWKEDPNSPIRAVKRFAGAAKGYLSTSRRLAEGDNAEGMSPDADIHSGGARYLFTTPMKDSDWIHNLGYPSGVVAHPSLAFQYLGNYANDHDNYTGKRKEGDNLLETLSGPYGTGPEMMVLNGISIADSWFTFTTSEQKPILIKQLREAGVTEINGLPLEKYFVVPGVDSVPDWNDPHRFDGP